MPIHGGLSVVVVVVSLEFYFITPNKSTQKLTPDTKYCKQQIETANKIIKNSLFIELFFCFFPFPKKKNFPLKAGKI